MLSFLIATSKSFSVYMDGSYGKVQTEKGSYYGITWDEKYIYVLARNRAGGGAESLEVFDTSLNHVNSVVLDGMKDGHQICWINNYVYIMDSCGGLIWKFDPKTGGVTKFAYEGLTPENHANSIWFGDNHYYVCEHNFGPSNVRVFNRNFVCVDCYPIGQDIHNVFVDIPEDVMYVCDSMGQSLCAIDLVTRAELGRVGGFDVNGNTEWFTRGLARWEKHFYVGLSRFGSGTERELFELGSVVIVDDEMKLVDQIIMKGCGQLNEIRLLGVPDMAHNGITLNIGIKSGQEDY